MFRVFFKLSRTYLHLENFVGLENTRKNVLMVFSFVMLGDFYRLNVILAY